MEQQVAIFIVLLLRVFVGVHLEIVWGKGRWWGMFKWLEAREHRY